MKISKKKSKNKNFIYCTNTMKKITLHVRGMHCNACKLLLENSIGSIKHVKKIDVHVKNGTAIIGYEENEPNQEDIIKVIEES